MRATIATVSASLLLLVSAPPAEAQSSDSGPALGVARISLINGDVTTKRGDSGDWVAAEINGPLVEGDVIETGPGSRVEIQLDYANLIRLDGSTTVEITELGDRRFRVRLLDGRLTYSELKDGEADIDIETPLAAVRPRERGRYEVAVAGDETTVQVRRGRTEIASVDGIETLDQGKMMTIRDGGAGAGPEFRTDRALPSDPWDEWNESRDERLSNVRSYQYVSQDIVGAGDLDDYGNWRYVSGYGNVWYPSGVGAGWAPYRQGRWAWVDYYGWNWVGYEPWGWAPYHYGRWFYSSGFGWGWWPGYRHHRHYYRPALVSFFGYGGGNGFSFGVGIGFGRVGWVPLAPGEIYRPWYGRGYYGGYRGGFRGNQTIIVDNSVNIYNNYRNARAHNGVTVVDANGFSRGQVNNPTSLRGEELQRASLLRGQIPVAPSRESQGRLVRSSARGGNSVAARATSVRTFSRGGTDATRSARLERVPFDQQRNQIVSSVRDFRTNGSARDNAAAAAGGVRSAGGDGRGSLGGAQAPASRAGADSNRTIVRGGAAGTTSVSRSRTDLAGGSSSIRSGSGATSRSGATAASGGWRTLGSSPNGRTNRAAGPSSSRSGLAGSDRGSGGSNGGSSVRLGSRDSASSRSSSPQRSVSRVDRGSGGSVGRSGVSRAPSSSRSSVTTPQRSVSRAPSSSRSNGGGSYAPRSESRVPRSSVSGGGGSYGRSPGASPSRAPSVNRAPSSSRSGGGYPQMQSRRSSAPQMSMPSRAPSGGSFGGGRSSSGPSMRSAPSRAPSGGSFGGGGSVRSGGGGGGGGVRSAPSHGRSGGRGR
ncbi:MAG: hypothetical protein GC160_15145 [Acidobacteria bacterium]|nr:hypothetical protein [Acidobacteriota bacterium]